MTAPKTDAWMPLWIGSYLADTQHLSRDEHGAYLLLLMAYWRTGSPLADDDKRLASITKASPRDWKFLRVTMAEFFTVADGVWSHKRVEKELKMSQTNKNNAVKKAKNAAEARWGHQAKDAPSIPSSIAPSITQALHEQCPTPSPLPTPSELNTVPDGTLSPATLPPCPHDTLIDLFGQNLPTLPQPKKELWQGKNAEAMRARWKWVMTAKKESGERYATTKGEAVGWFSRFFGYVAGSDFLSGRSGKWMSCDLGWLMKADNFTKVVQGNYQNKEAA